MKYAFSIILFCGFMTTVNAQKQSYQEKKATTNAHYVADKMDLNTSKKTFLYTILLGRYVGTSNEIKGNNLSDEEKKAVYKKYYQETNDKLAVMFSKEEINAINALLKEQNKKKE